MLETLIDEVYSANGILQCQMVVAAVVVIVAVVVLLLLLVLLLTGKHFPADMRERPPAHACAPTHTHARAQSILDYFPLTGLDLLFLKAQCLTKECIL